MEFLQGENLVGNRATSVMRRQPRHTPLGIGEGLPEESETGNHFPLPGMFLVEAETLTARLSSGGDCSLVPEAVKPI